MYPYDKLHNGISKRYSIIGKYCGACPLKEGCLPKNYNKRSRFMFRSPYQDEIDKVKKRQKTAHFKNKLYERQWKIEGLFAEAKQNHGLCRTQYRGIQKFQIQCYMTALVQNIKRIIRLILLFLYIFYEKNEIENNIYSFFKYIKFLNKSGVCSQLQIDWM